MSYLSQCFRLFSLHIRMQLGISALGYYRRHDRKKFRQIIGIMAAVLYGFGTVVVVYGITFGALLGGAKDLNMGVPILAAAFFIAMATTMIFGMFQLSATVFNAKDIEWYAALPVKPGAVFFAKLGMAYLVESAACFMILIPTYIIYSGTPGAGGAWFWTAAVIAMPLTPLLPMAVAAIAALPVSRLTAMVPKRGYVTAAVTFVLVLAFTAAAMLLPRELVRVFEEGSGSFEGFLADNEAFLRGVGKVFPPAAWLAKALTSPMPQGLFYLLLFAAVSAAAVLLAVLLAGRLYYKSAMAMIESSATGSQPRKRLGAPGTGFKIGARRRKPWAALTVLEIKQLFRSPLYTMNSLSGMFFGLMILIMPLVLGDEFQEFREFAKLGASPDVPNRGLVIIIASIVLSVAGVLNVAASTSVSREGMSFWMGLTVPVRPRSHIMGKYLCSLLVALITVVVMLVCLIIVLPALTPILLYALPPAVCATAATTGMSMLPDMLRPKLKWDSEAEAMKQNLNSLLGMLTSSPAIILMGLIAVWAGFFSPSAPTVIIVSTVICGGMAAGAVALVRHVAEATYRKMGERG